MKAKLQAKLGVSPICWWNDDLAESSDDDSLEECFAQTPAAGFTGLEAGCGFPKDAKIHGPMLRANKVEICGGCYSGMLLDGGIEAEKKEINPCADGPVQSRRRALHRPRRSCPLDPGRPLEAIGL